jgi:small subunit ribosomal protein S7
MNSSSSPRPEEEQPKGPNEDHLPHVSKEAAQTDRIVGEKCDGNTPGSPELEQGTPVDEVSPLDVQ